MLILTLQGRRRAVNTALCNKIFSTGGHTSTNFIRWKCICATFFCPLKFFIKLSRKFSSHRRSELPRAWCNIDFFLCACFFIAAFLSVQLERSSATNCHAAVCRLRIADFAKKRRLFLSTAASKVLRVLPAQASCLQCHKVARKACIPLYLSFAQRKQFLVGVPQVNAQAHFSTQPASPLQGAWFSHANENKERKGRTVPSPRQRTQARFREAWLPGIAFPANVYSACQTSREKNF